MSHERLQRLELLIAKEGIEALQNSCVMIVGIGGVGGSAVEALARSGIGKLILIDGDFVQESNMNRQVVATMNTIGKDKVLVMKEKILQINPNCKVEAHKIFFDKTKKELLDTNIDFVIDAIDTISSKLDLMEICLEKEIPFISCLGMGNRFDPSKIKLTRLDKTENDPFAKAVRANARKRGMTLKIPVVVSEELPHTQTVELNEAGKTRKERIPPASTAFVPPAAGLLCASVAVQTITEKIKRKH